MIDSTAKDIICSFFTVPTITYQVNSTLCHGIVIPLYLDTDLPTVLSTTNDLCVLLCLSLNSSQEMRQLQSQTGGDVSVEVNAAPGEDLTKTLNDLRNEYEEIIARNRKEVEQWYEVKVRSNAQSGVSFGGTAQTPWYRDWLKGRSSLDT